MTGEMCPLGEGRPFGAREPGRGDAMPGMIRPGSAAAFGNAGKPVTDGAKCACLAFIDRHWCDHPVQSAGGPDVWPAEAGRCHLVAGLMCLSV